MRNLFSSVIAVTVLVGVSSAGAADLDYGVLRGAEDEYVAPAAIDWSGVYVGAHGGYTSASLHTAKSLAPWISTALTGSRYYDMFDLGWAGPVSANAQSGSYGAFAGYNFQFDDTVVGIEADYTHTPLSAGTGFILPNPATRHAPSLIASTNTALTDYGTIRARVGYAIGSFLPFVTAGGAFGRIVETDALAVALTSNKVGIAPLTKTSERQTFGFTVGGGLDYAVTQNIILRAEYQYIRFDDFTNQRINANYKIDVNTFRGGAAVKF